MIVRMGGVLFVILGLLYLHDSGNILKNRLRLRLDSVIPKNSSVAGIMTSSDVSGREIFMFTSSQMHSLFVEEARSSEEKRLGLMYRDSLCEDCGMLFIYETDVNGSFWMKNCKIPLDIIFISENKRILDIRENFQPCSADPCSTYRPSSSYRYVLEVNAGWAERHNLKSGDNVSL